MMEYELNQTELADFLRAKRLEKKMSQKELAAKCGTNPGRIGTVESSKGEKYLHVELLGKMCQELDINIREAIDILYYPKDNRTKLLIEDETIKSKFDVAGAVVNKETIEIINFLYEMVKGLLAKNVEDDKDNTNCGCKAPEPQRDYS